MANQSYIETNKTAKMANDVWFYDESCDSVPEEIYQIESEPDLGPVSFKAKKKIVNNSKINIIPLFNSNNNDFGFK